MFQIGDFSRICRLPVSMLRYYADIGLLEPHHVDPSTNYRYYSLDQLPRLNRILALKDLGLSLDEIAQILQENLPGEQLRGMLRLKEAEISGELKAAQERLARVAARLEHIEKEGEMPAQEVVLKAIEPLTCLSIRRTVPSGEHVGYLLGESATAAVGNGTELAGAPFVIFHDMEFKPADLDVEVVFPVKNAVKQAIELESGGQLVSGQLQQVSRPQPAFCTWVHMKNSPKPMLLWDAGSRPTDIAWRGRCARSTCARRARETALSPRSNSRSKMPERFSLHFSPCFRHP